MLNVVFAAVVLAQLLGLVTLATAIQRARDGREDTSGFHQTSDPSDQPEQRA